jgi:hypothetical protein
VIFLGSETWSLDSLTGLASNAERKDRANEISVMMTFGEVVGVELEWTVSGLFGGARNNTAHLQMS